VIVRQLDDRLLLITQPAHAHLSRLVMERCVALRERPRRASILHAIGEHDNGWAEPDAAPEVDPAAGRIYDFVSAPLRVRHGVWPRGVARLAQDPWAAALVAQHAIAVYDRYRGQPEWDPFFAEMKASRDALLRASGQARAELEADYVFVRLGDLISLLFCTGWTEGQRVGPWSLSTAGTRVIVSPDPFAAAAIPLEIEAREIRSGPFRSNTELREALAFAGAVTMSGTAAGN
jgi:hypothetical protein